MGKTHAVTLRADGAARIRAGHPWVYDRAVARVDGEPGPGALVRVNAPSGERQGEGLYSPASRVRVRMLTVRTDSPLEGEEALLALVARRLREAMGLRDRLGYGDAARLVFGESDGLPGLVVDRYGGAVVAQFLSAGMDARKENLADLLASLPGVGLVVERSDTGSREREGLASVRRPLRGTPPGDGLVPFRAGGLSLLADVLEGQKTGFYLDQRDNWTSLSGIAQGARVLDACCYTGAFGLALLAGGADRLLAIDSSRRALAVAGETARRNGLADRAAFVQGDAAGELASLARRGETFGFTVLDPPALARSRLHRTLALRAYRGYNAAAIAVTEPGGFLFTCSCTPWVGAAELTQMLAEAAARTGRAFRVLETRGQSRDHPVHPLMPETRYLACLLAQVS